MRICRGREVESQCCNSRRKTAAPASAPTLELRGLTPNEEGLMPIIVAAPTDSQTPKRVGR